MEFLELQKLYFYPFIILVSSVRHLHCYFIFRLHLFCPFIPFTFSFATMPCTLLLFLNCTKSFFFVDVYPYFTLSGKDTSFDYALLRETKNYTDPISGLTYTNLLEQRLDSVIFAMAKLGYFDISLAISEAGWPILVI